VCAGTSTHPSLKPLTTTNTHTHTRARAPVAPQDALKTRKPDPGATAGVGRAGRIGSTGGTLLTQHLLKTRGKLISTDAEMDAREAILRHGDKDDEMSALTAAYAKTQPRPIYAQPEPEDDEEAQ
jgi:hypothetical protein